MSTSVENNPQAVHNAQQQPNSNYQASVTASQSAQQLHQYNVSPQAQPHFQVSIVTNYVVAVGKLS